MARLLPILQLFIWNLPKSKAATRDALQKQLFLKIHRIQGETPVPEPLLKKVAGIRPATLLKNRLCHRCFPVSFVKFLRTPFLQNIAGRLLLQNVPLPGFNEWYETIYNKNINNIQGVPQSPEFQETTSWSVSPTNSEQKQSPGGVL